jgi:hypothetical protein
MSPDALLLSSANIVPQAQEQRLLVRVDSLAGPRHNKALAKPCESLNSLEIRYPGTDLTLVSEAPGLHRISRPCRES